MTANAFPANALQETLVVMALEVEAQGRFERGGIPVLYTGVGKINASIGLMRRLHDYRSAGRELPLVLNFGTAGSKRWPRGALVACQGFVQLDMDVSALGFPPGHTPFDAVPARLDFPPLFAHLPEGTSLPMLTHADVAICGSGDSFATGTPPLACDVIDMEAYALAKVCHVEGARFACVKYVTDGADETAAVEWQDNLTAAADAFWQLYQAMTSGR
jgi:adenosylhomocysteine nucleosidase